MSNIFPDLRGVALVAGLVEHILVALETFEYHASVTVQNLDKMNVIKQIKISKQTTLFLLDGKQVVQNTQYT